MKNLKMLLVGNMQQETMTMNNYSLMNLIAQRQRKFLRRRLSDTTLRYYAPCGNATTES